MATSYCSSSDFEVPDFPFDLSPGIDLLLNAAVTDASILQQAVTCGGSQEFKGRPRSYYEEAFQAGRLRVEAPNIMATTPLRTSHRIVHSLHRHEPPVLCQPLQVCLRTSHHVRCTSAQSHLLSWQCSISCNLLTRTRSTCMLPMILRQDNTL